MRKIRELRNVLGLVGFGVLVSCTQDPNQTKLQYMPDMADAPTYARTQNEIAYYNNPGGGFNQYCVFWHIAVKFAFLCRHYRRAIFDSRESSFCALCRLLFGWRAIAISSALWPRRFGIFGLVSSLGQGSIQ